MLTSTQQHTNTQHIYTPSHPELLVQWLNSSLPPSDLGCVSSFQFPISSFQFPVSWMNVWMYGMYKCMSVWYFQFPFCIPVSRCFMSFDSHLEPSARSKTQDRAGRRRQSQADTVKVQFSTLCFQFPVSSFQFPVKYSSVYFSERCFLAHPGVCVKAI